MAVVVRSDNYIIYTEGQLNYFTVLHTCMIFGINI